MNINIDLGYDEVISVVAKNQIVDKLNSSYPEVAMMLAMEECNELAIAISKCVRNGSDDKKDNLAEEIIDVLTIIQWAIRRFGITEEMLKKWNDYKSERLESRDKTDEVVFRSDKAREAYKSNRVDSQNQLVITRSKNGQYVASGDTRNALEYYHVLNTYLTKCGLLNPSRIDSLTEDIVKNIFGDDALFSKDDAFLSESPLQLSHPWDYPEWDYPDKDNKDKAPRKMIKGTVKDLDKLIEKASKKAKHIDSSKKKIDKKKKGKKGKK